MPIGPCSRCYLARASFGLRRRERACRPPRSAPEACGGATFEATKRVRGATKWGWNCMRTLPLGHVGHKTCEGCAEIEVELHADSLIGALGGAPYGATKRARVVSKQ